MLNLVLGLSLIASAHAAGFSDESVSCRIITPTSLAGDTLVVYGSEFVGGSPTRMIEIVRHRPGPDHTSSSKVIKKMRFKFQNVITSPQRFEFFRSGDSQLRLISEYGGYKAEILLADPVAGDIYIQSVCDSGNEQN